MNEEIILNECMAVKKKEKILIVYDKNKIKIADSIYNKAKELEFDVDKIETKIAKENGEEPPEEVAKEMLNYDVILLITTKSLSHTKARRDASKNARIASMPNITEDLMSRMNVDYKKMKELIEKIEKILAKAKKIRIITEKGTDITTEIGSDYIFKDTGLYIEKGDFGNLPAGEVAILPKNTNGVFVVDATFAGVEKLDEPIKVTVKDNYAVKIEGGDEADKLREIIDQFKGARNIAEFAVGVNDKAKITGVTLEDEKVLGTAHFALGNDKSFGGDVDVKLHLDGVFFAPTIFIDNEKIMDKGKYEI